MFYFFYLYLFNILIVTLAPTGDSSMINIASPNAMFVVAPTIFSWYQTLYRSTLASTEINGAIELQLAACCIHVLEFEMQTQLGQQPCI